MARIILINKPYNMLSQFTDKNNRETLSSLFENSQHDIRNFYPAGRLDRDSEGLLLLTDNGALQHRISAPENKLPKTYWVQIEGTPDETELNALRQGVNLKDGITRPAKVKQIPHPNIWPRSLPIRERKNLKTHWLQMEITEGKNRQVRRMTAAVDLPTLRLIRVAIGPWRIEKLLPGEYRFQEVHLPQARKKYK